MVRLKDSKYFSHYYVVLEMLFVNNLNCSVYEDVPKAFENWINAEKKIYIYSSGSLLAQKLLFQYSEFGNLLVHITDHFDTKVGMKQEAESYKKITTEIGVAAENCLFLTDIVKGK